MKETIYTIPLNEAYSKGADCPLCEIKRRLEIDAVSYSLGAAMMEPDYRIESNKKGYCNTHFGLMLSHPEKLSLALVLKTHTDEILDNLDSLSGEIEAFSEKGLFKKYDAKKTSQKLLKILEEKNSSCVICDRINYHLERYYEILVDMWVSDAEFKAKFDSSNGVCLPHFESLVRVASKKLSEKNLRDFITSLYEKEIVTLKKTCEDVHKFTLKFDYRNRDMDFSDVKDAPKKSILKLSGGTDKTDD